jgi:hypothetical protein
MMALPIRAMAKRHLRRPALLALALAAGAAGSAPAREKGVEIIHTPWLALRFVQDGKEAPMVRRNLYLAEVRLRRAPFRLLLPKRGPDDVYQLCAWTDDSIFSIAYGGERPRRPDAPEPFYFSPGTGIADSEAGSGTLYLRNDGHNYLIGLRLGPDPDRHEVQYSTLWNERGETRIEDVDGPLYLVAFFDEDKDGRLENGEYDLIKLVFTG